MAIRVLLLVVLAGPAFGWDPAKVDACKQIPPDQMDYGTYLDCCNARCGEDPKCGQACQDGATRAQQILDAQKKRDQDARNAK